MDVSATIRTPDKDVNSNNNNNKGLQSRLRSVKRQLFHGSSSKRSSSSTTATTTPRKKSYSPLKTPLNDHDDDDDFAPSLSARATGDDDDTVATTPSHADRILRSPPRAIRNLSTPRIDDDDDATRDEEDGGGDVVVAAGSDDATDGSPAPTRRGPVAPSPREATPEASRRRRDGRCDTPPPRLVGRDDGRGGRSSRGGRGVLRRGGMDTIVERPQDESSVSSTTSTEIVDNRSPAAADEEEDEDPAASLVAALRRAAPLGAVRTLLARHPDAADDGRALFEAVRRGAPAAVVEEVLRACPGALFASSYEETADLFYDPLSYAKTYRREDAEVTALLERPLSHWRDEKKAPVEDRRPTTPVPASPADADPFVVHRRETRRVLRALRASEDEARERFLERLEEAHRRSLQTQLVAVDGMHRRFLRQAHERTRRELARHEKATNERSAALERAVRDARDDAVARVEAVVRALERRLDERERERRRRDDDRVRFVPQFLVPAMAGNDPSPSPLPFPVYPPVSPTDETRECECEEERLLLSDNPRGTDEWSSITESCFGRGTSSETCRSVAPDPDHRDRPPRSTRHRGALGGLCPRATRLDCARMLRSVRAKCAVASSSSTPRRSTVDRSPAFVPL